MKLNLKKFAQDKAALKFVHKRLHEQREFRPLASKLNKIINFMDEIETDLELGGECIIDLDKDRMAAVEERNKMLAILREGDDEV